MATGFVLVLLREIRESIQKLREEIAARPDGPADQGAGTETGNLDQLTERLNQTNERLEQALASLGRVESDLNELQKFMRRMALNQVKHEQLHTQNVDNLEHDVREIKEQLNHLKQRI